MSARLDSLLDAGRMADILRHDLLLGGISSLDSAATRRALDRQYSESDARLAARQFLFESFTTQAASCTLDKSVLFDALDYRDYIARAMQILMNAAAGKGVQGDAQALIEEVAAHWADMEVSDD